MLGGEHMTKVTSTGRTGSMFTRKGSTKVGADKKERKNITTVFLKLNRGELNAASAAKQLKTLRQKKSKGVLRYIEALTST